jgi:hypothetical protein
VLTTRPFSVQWTKVLLGVAVTVFELPSANVPPPLTVPPALGEAAHFVLMITPFTAVAPLSSPIVSVTATGLTIGS